MRRTYQESCLTSLAVVQMTVVQMTVVQMTVVRMRRQWRM
jgi:hypothetical protein